MKLPISFFVPGHPRPGGSKTAFPLRRGGVYIRSMIVDASGPKGKEWRKTVAWYAKKAMGSEEPWDCAIRLELEFWMERPKSHLKKDGSVRPNHSRHHLSKPDVLKLARSIEDALTGIVWRDDCLIVDEILSKRYGIHGGVSITVEEVE